MILCLDECRLQRPAQHYSVALPMLTKALTQCVLKDSDSDQGPKHNKKKDYQHSHISQAQMNLTSWEKAAGHTYSNHH